MTAKYFQIYLSICLLLKYLALKWSISEDYVVLFHVILAGTV